MSFSLDMKKEPSKESKPATNRYANVTIEDTQLGIWRFMVAHEKPRSLKDIKNHVTELWTGYWLTMYRLLADIYSVAPWALTLYFVGVFAGAAETAVQMSLTSKMLRLVEVTLNERKPVPINEVVWCLGMIVFWSMITGVRTHLNAENWIQLRRKVEDHFKLMILKADLARDLPTSQDETTVTQLRAWEAFHALEGLSRRLGYIVSATSQIAVVVQIGSSSGGPLFIAACLARPFVTQCLRNPIWDTAYLGYDNNAENIKLHALSALSQERYRQDVISGNLSQWITQEFIKTRERMGYVRIDHPENMYGDNTKDLLWVVVGEILENFPWMYSIFYSLLNPAQCSLSGIAVMQSSTANLRNTFSNLMDEDCETKKRIGKLQSLYSAKEIKNVMEDEELDYPHEKSHPEGMSFELSDVNFSYPTTQKKESSLSSVNLKIHSGSVVVIVGSNGSGKSTLIRLLSRLYEPTSGSLLIDERPSKTYRTTSLRESSILLSQDHNIFPMSFVENIGLGCPSLMDNLDLIKGSAEKGGAKEFIEKLDKGFDTIIHPMVAIAANKLEHQPDHPLQEEKKKISKKSNISGGEQQRVVAARAFMRMNSGKIRFVAVDEPTSALDSEGELQLFTRLLEAREGKTMVFVTHRFGYLTKHADMIVCMKNGTVEEVGTHSELYANKTGEYTKLYNIQANAFLADS